MRSRGPTHRTRKLVAQIERFAELASTLASSEPAAAKATKAKELVKSLGLAQVQDRTQLEAWCREALAGKEKIIADVKAGKTQALNALLGGVMKSSKGTANPKVVQEILLELIQRAP